MVPLVNLTYGVAMGQRPRKASETALGKGLTDSAEREMGAADPLRLSSSRPGRLTARIARLLFAALAHPAFGRDLR
jgi:hypothetical protein